MMAWLRTLTAEVQPDLRSSRCRALPEDLPVCSTQVYPNRRGFTHRLLLSQTAPMPRSDARSPEAEVALVLAWLLEYLSMRSLDDVFALQQVGGFPVPFRSVK